MDVGEDEPDIFYDCYDQDYDESLREVADNLYCHLTDDQCHHCDHHHDHSGQVRNIISIIIHNVVFN